MEKAIHFLVIGTTEVSWKAKLFTLLGSHSKIVLVATCGVLVVLDFLVVTKYSLPFVFAGRGSSIELRKTSLGNVLCDSYLLDIRCLHLVSSIIG
jgi:hypothetical protein